MGVFDIIGPVMIGPSSSHTAGAARLGRLVRYLLGEKPVRVVLTFYGSFAQTYRGHGTDRACVAGLLGWAPDDPRLREALELASSEGLEVTITTSDEDAMHPNTARFEVTGESGAQHEYVGISTGGGRIRLLEIDKHSVDLDGASDTLVTVHHDRPGIVAFVSRILADAGVNISAMRLYRKERHQAAQMFIETDTPVGDELLAHIGENEAIDSVRVFPPV